MRQNVVLNLNLTKLQQVCSANNNELTVHSLEWVPKFSQNGCPELPSVLRYPPHPFSQKKERMGATQGTHSVKFGYPF